MDYEFEMYDAIDFGHKSYGLMSTDDGDLFVEIRMRDDRCYFDDDYYCLLYTFMQTSENNMHLFVH